MPTTFASYAVSDGQQVSVEITSGDGQPATISLVLDGAILKKGKNHIDPVDVGEGASLRSRQLVVAMTVSLLNPDTTRTSALVELKGGREPKEVKTEQSGVAGGKVSYVIVVAFS